MRGKAIPVHMRTKEEAIPPAVLNVAKRRAGDMMKFYGAFIETISLEALCVSIYVQGLEDMAQAAVNEMTPPAPIDFVI